MSRVIIVLAAVLNALILAANVAWGFLLTTPFSAAGVIACVVVIVMHTHRIGILRARERELNRPRMTPEDYRQLREMEIELGWEPSGPACDCGKSAEEHAREWDEQVIASQGIPPARLADGEGKDATETALHFAQLANVGREHCIGFCPICAARKEGIA
jgi:hypothetical protein